MITPLHSKIIKLLQIVNAVNLIAMSVSLVIELSILNWKNPDNVPICYLNINSIRNKFENFTGIFQNNVDVLVVAETKKGETFPPNQFYIPGFKRHYRLDVSGKSGGLLAFTNEQIPSKQLEGVDIPNYIQVLIIELNLKKIKWLLLPVYKHSCQNDMYFGNEIERIVDFYTKTIGNVLVFGDFNMEESNPCIKLLIQQYSYNLI